MTDAPHICFHCGLPNPPGTDVCADLLGEKRYFCCPGCRAVAETICASGLTDYYRLRDKPGITAPSIPDELDRYDSEEMRREAVFSSDSCDETTLLIDGIQCAACTWLLERHLQRLPGVVGVEANLGRRLLHIRWNPKQQKLSDLLRSIRGIGYRPSLWSADREEESMRQENRRSLMRLGVAGIGMMQVGMYAIALHAGALQGIDDTTRRLLEVASLIVATAVIFYAARPFFQNAWRGIRNLAPGMDVPVAGAIGIAYAASLWATLRGEGAVYFDSVSMFTFLLLLSRYLEMRSRLLLARQGERIPLPEFALRDDPAGPIATPPGQLKAGEHLLIRPGERVPVDCTVSEGSSAVDNSLLTGEFLPRLAGPGDELLAGSLNGDGLLKAVVLRPLTDSRATRIVDMLGTAQARKVRIARLADQIASFFVTGILLTAVAVYLFWLTRAPDRALWITLSVLVVSCPCALSLATPTAITAALARLRRDGILVRNSEALESLPTIDCVVFDKTGTLTEGRMAVVRTDNRSGDVDRNRAIAAALERYSNHPIAAAFKQAQPLPPSVTDVHLVPGQGVEGAVDGIRYRIGSTEFTAVDPAKLSTEGEVPVVLRQVDGAICAIFYLFDPPRPDAASALEHLNRYVAHTRVFTGDSSMAINRLAPQLGIGEWEKGMSPERKLEQLEALRGSGARVMAVGDGVNDVLLLAAADVSVAVDTSIEITRHSADIVMVNPSLLSLASLFECGLRLRRTIRQNLAWALLYNVSAIPLAAAGLVPPWLAVIGMSASSLVVVINALRLSRSR